MQRFGRKAVYIVIGDGVEEEQGAKKVQFVGTMLDSSKFSFQLPFFYISIEWSSLQQLTISLIS